MKTEESSIFETIPSDVLCRIGGNDSNHPSHYFGLMKVEKGESLLDVGSGSGTTIECILKYFPFREIKYKGVERVKRHVDWCKEMFPDYPFEVQDAMHLKEKDNSWDVVWSRHVVDHLPSFEDALDEYIRVAKKKVICILWQEMNYREEHKIGHHIDMSNKIEYVNDYLNQYSVCRVVKHLVDKFPEWRTEIYFNVGIKLKAHDTVLYLYKNPDYEKSKDSDS